MIIDELIGPSEKKLELALEEARAKFAHAGYKGAAVENAVRDLLSSTLPARLQVGQGEVVDTRGNRSAQVDVIVATDDHPRFLVPERYLIEGVVAAGEVKSLLSSGDLASALGNSRRFKRLAPVPVEDEIVFVDAPETRRFYLSRPYFLLALESQLSIDTVEDRVRKASEEAAAANDRVLDAVFVLRRGWIIDLGEGNGPFQRMQGDGTPLRGWVGEAGTAVLFNFLAWLSAVMPRPWQQRPIISAYLG